MPHNHDRQYSKILEYLIDLNVLKTMLPDHGMYCEMQLLSLLDFSITVSLCFSNFNFIFYTTGKISQNNPNMCWHIYTRPPIGFTTSECFISCKMCSDKISLKLGMIKHMLMSFTYANFDFQFSHQDVQAYKQHKFLLLYNTYVDFVFSL